MRTTHPRRPHRLYGRAHVRSAHAYRGSTPANRTRGAAILTSQRAKAATHAPAETSLRLVARDEIPITPPTTPRGRRFGLVRRRESPAT